MVTTSNLNLAVAFGTCGVGIEIEKSQPVSMCRGDSSLKPVTLFHLADANTPNDPAPDLTGADMEQAAKWALLIHRAPLAFRTGIIKARLDREYLKQLKNGWTPLEDAEPLHPILDCLIGLGIRESLRTYMERGTRYHVQCVPGVPRAVFRLGQEPVQPASFSTSSLALAAALIRCGVPVVGCDGPAGARRLHFPALGHALDGHGPVDAPKLAAALAGGTLARQCPGHPAVWVFMAIENRNRLLANIKDQRAQLLLHDPRTLAWGKHHRSAVIYEGQGAEVWRKAKEHIRAV